MNPKLKYVGIRVKDLEKSKRFYTGLLDMEEILSNDHP